MCPLPTDFAPAEREPESIIFAQADYFEHFPLLKKLLDAVPDVFLILNEQRQIVYANRLMLEQLGIASPKPIYGMRPGEALGCAHADVHTGGCGTSVFCGTCGAVRAILTSLKGEHAVEECRISLADGGSLDLRVWGTPLQLGEQRLSLFTVKDISHEKRRRALERIFFHDILNTAGVLMGFAHLLQDASPEEFEIIKGQFPVFTDRLVEEIKAQRELSAAENDELTPHPVPIDAWSLMAEVAALYAQHEVAEGRSISITPPPAPVEIESDLTLLRRVLSNMVKNGLEASAPGETVTLRCEATPDAVIFHVHNPTYIPRNIQMQIFQRSFSTKGSGRGLGTYSIKLLAERYLGGRVWFTTSETDGTCFSVALKHK